MADGLIRYTRIFQTAIREGGWDGCTPTRRAEITAQVIAARGGIAVESARGLAVKLTREEQIEVARPVIAAIRGGATAAQAYAQAANGNDAGAAGGHNNTAAANHATPTTNYALILPYKHASYSPAARHERPWIAPKVLLRREESILIGQPGSAKTTLAVGFGVALTCGRSNFGSIRINNKPNGLKVLYIAAEENENNMELLIAAAGKALAVSADEEALIRQNFAFIDATLSDWQFGAPRPGQREDIAPESDDQSYKQLIETIIHGNFDIVVFDTIAALLATPNENDNPLNTKLLRRILRAATQTNCAVLMLHHMPKMTAKAAAELRGDPSAARGGGAFTATPRIVLTITEPTNDEAGLLAMQGFDPEHVRRLHGAKNNHGPKLEPMHLRLSLETIDLSDGKTDIERAVQFDVPMVSTVAITAGNADAANADAGIDNATRTLVMSVIEKGVVKAGHKLPLAASNRGATGKRAAIPTVACELIAVHPRLPEVHALAAAKQILKDLIGKGCVVERTFAIPKSEGGTGKPTKNLEVNWAAAPWMNGAGAAPVMPSPGSSPDGTQGYDGLPQRARPSVV